MLNPHYAKIEANRRHSTSSGERYVDGARYEELRTTPALARLSMVEISQPRSPISPISKLRDIQKKACSDYKNHLEQITALERSGNLPEKRGEWSGIGQRYDVRFTSLSTEIQGQLKCGVKLGEGGFGSVHKVICHRIPLADKSIKVERRALERIKLESKHAARLAGNNHFARLVGTYLEGDLGTQTFHILSYPVANMDLSTFLDECEHLGKLNANRMPTSGNLDKVNMVLEQLAIAAAVDMPGPQEMRSSVVPPTFRNFLKKMMGCLAAAIDWMHSHKISHLDLKPQNILVHNGTMFVTDFGVSRDRSEAQSSWTQYLPAGTPTWSPPELQVAKLGELNAPFKVDVYELGLIYLHMITVAYGRKTRTECGIIHWNYQNRETNLKAHFQLSRWNSFRARFTWQPDSASWPPQGIVELIRLMLNHDPKLRPSSKDAKGLLLAMGGKESIYHGKCCYRAYKEDDITPELRKKMKHYLK